MREQILRNRGLYIAVLSASSYRKIQRASGSEIHHEIVLVAHVIKYIIRCESSGHTVRFQPSGSQAQRSQVQLLRCVSALIKHGQVASEKINLCNVRCFIEIAPVKLHPINQVAPLPNESRRLNGKLMG